MVLGDLKIHLRSSGPRSRRPAVPGHCQPPRDGARGPAASRARGAPKRGRSPGWTRGLPPGSRPAEKGLELGTGALPEEEEGEAERQKGREGSSPPARAARAPPRTQRARRGARTEQPRGAPARPGVAALPSGSICSRRRAPALAEPPRVGPGCAVTKAAAGRGGWVSSPSHCSCIAP